MSNPSRPVRILHVDDKPDFAELTATYLEREDERFDVEIATDVDAGLSRLAATDFDCVVSDYDMPGQDGIEFLQAVREDSPDLPFVLFTGKGSEEIASEAISAGVTDYIQKKSGPDQYTLLANRIQNAVERVRSRRQRERQLDAIETAQEGISILDEEGHYIYVNEAFATLHGYQPEEMIGEHWEIAYPDEDVQDVRENILPEVERTGYWHGETTSRRSDGTDVIVDHTLALTDQGELVCTVRDISGRKERKEKLRRSTARLEALFEHSPDMINVHDMDGNIIDPNPSLCEATGYDADELTDMKVWELDQAIDPDEARTLWNGMDHGDRERVEGVYQRRDGSAFPVEVHIRRLNVDGAPRFMVISREISEQKERERDLTETNQLLSTLFETLPVGVTILDTDGTIIQANQRAEDVLGLTESDITGRTYNAPEWEIFGEGGEPVPDEQLPFARVIETGERVFGYEHGIKWPDGTEQWLSINAAPITTDGDEIERVVTTLTDITDAREYQRAVEAQNERLDEFASIVSHDLRNPLSVAKGRLELAGEECDSEHLDAVGRAHDRMETLITDLLTLARDGETATEVTSVDLATLAEGCWENVDTARATLNTHDTRTIRADEPRLRQLFENLIRNSVEHGGADVTVTIGGLANGFYVEDDGPGVPADEREVVFKAGYSTGEGKTGFGLRIVKQVCDAHGWDIHVTDGSAGGARFEITGVEFTEEERH